MLSNLTTTDRRALVLAKAYEDERRKCGQYGYKAFKQDEDVLKNRIFKQFRTVVKWLSEFGWRIGWLEVHWQGFVKFVFSKMNPTIPQPGQLKNKKLLSEYLKSAPEVQPVLKMEPDDLESLYHRILRPEITSDPLTMKILGVCRL